MRRFLVVLSLALGLTVSAQAAALTDQPLVDAIWLKERLGHPDLVVLDVRARAKDQPDPFAAGHIPGAVFADYNTAGWRAEINGVPGQLPPVESLAALIGGLGIDNDDHVVIVPAGETSSDFGNATRVYWTFKVLGHRSVSILNGGYKAWTLDASNPVETGAAGPVAPATFAAEFQPQLLATLDDVLKARETGVALIDARPVAQYLGQSKSPVVRTEGTIPGAVSVPNDALTGGQAAYFVDASTIESLLRDVGVDPQGEQIAFCNTGHWASVAWFGLSEVLGNGKVSMYDGSMAEYAADPSRPIQLGAAK